MKKLMYLIIAITVLGLIVTGCGIPVVPPTEQNESGSLPNKSPDLYVPSVYLTIQAAINAAVPGDTIIVADGTYDEAITIGVANLTLQSETSLGAIIRPTTISGWPMAVVYITAAGDGVTVDGFEIDGTTVANNGIYGWETSGLTIKNNKIHGAVNDWDGCGILLLSWGNSGTVFNNLIENNEVYDTGRMGIMVMDYDGSKYTVTSGNTITGNIVYDVWEVPLGDGGGGIQINVGKDCAITDNLVYDVQNSQRGIYMFGSADGNIITGNTLRDNAIGIQLWISGEGGTAIDWGGEAATSPEVHYNNIYGNSSYGAKNTNIQGETMVMDATYNWWGHPGGPRRPAGNSGKISGPKTADQVSENVLYHPWLNGANSVSNIALDQTATASATYLSYTANLAVDGDYDTLWNSGDFSTQWIEIDLGKGSTVVGLRLLTAQSPPGITTHVVLFSDDGGVIAENTFFGDTETEQWLETWFDVPFNGVKTLRVTTTDSPSWVAWYEIEVYGWQ